MLMADITPICIVVTLNFTGTHAVAVLVSLHNFVDLFVVSFSLTLQRYCFFLTYQNFGAFFFIFFVSSSKSSSYKSKKTHGRAFTANPCS